MPENHGQHIVEVVGNTSCELPDKLHFLSMLQLHLESLPLCLQELVLSDI